MTRTTSRATIQQPDDPYTRALLRMVNAARAAGSPRDQVENFQRAGLVLQPRQWDMSAAARLCDYAGGPTEIGVGGARGGGKSHWLYSQIGADDCQRYDGLKALILRKVGKAVKESFDDFLPKVFGGLRYKYRPSRSAPVIFENESQIVLGHFQRESDIDAYLGLEYDVIGIEEGTTLSKTKIDAIRSVNRTSKQGWRPRLYMTTNPGNIGHAWFKNRFVLPFRAGEETETRFIPATVYDNRFVNPEYRRNLEMLTGWQRRAWLLGDWDIAAGQFFVTFRHGAHVIKPFREPPPLDWRVWLAMDYGFNHWNAVYLFTESNDGIVYVLDEHAERGWLPQRHAQAINEMLERNSIPRHRIYTFVAGGDVFNKQGDGKTVADRYAALGWHIQRAKMSRLDRAAEYLMRLGDPDEGIAPRLYITEHCTKLIECLPSMVHDPNRPEDVMKVDTDEDGEGGDDPYDASGYGLMVVARKGSLRSA